MIDNLRYDLNDSETAELLIELIAAEEERLPATDLTCFRISGTSRFANLARTVEADVFSDEFKVPRQQMADELRAFEAHSYLFLAVDIPAKAAIGALRVIENGENGFPTLNDLEEPPHSLARNAFFEHYGAAPERTWEVGTIAVNPRYRAEATSSIAVGLLYRSLYAGAVSNGIDHFVSMIIPDTLRKLRNLGIPFDDLMDLPPKVYWDDSLYQPAVAKVDEFDTRMRQFGQLLLNTADDDDRRSRAQFKASLIDALLTGNGFDDLVAFDHGQIRTASIR